PVAKWQGRVAAVHALALLDEVALDPPGHAHADRHVAVAGHDVARPRENGRGTRLSGCRQGCVRHRHRHGASGEADPGGEGRQQRDGDHRGQHPAALAARLHRCRRRPAVEAQRGELGAQLLVLRVGRHGLPYALRKASIGRKRAARQAGPNPPAVPITSASRSAAARSAAPTFSVITLMVKVAAPKPMPPSSMRRDADRPRAQTAPSTNPSPATASASTWNDVRIAAREKPRARSVPIAAVRACTAAYMLLAAPNPAPMPASTAIPTTST